MRGATVVRVDIPQHTANFNASLILAIRQSALRHGQQTCLRSLETVVIINRPEGQLIAATHDGVYWEEIRGTQQVTEDQIQIPTFPQQSTLPNQVIQSSEIARVIDGFTLGMPLEDTFRVVVNGIQDRRMVFLDTSSQQRFIAALQQRDALRATKDSRLMTENTQLVNALNIHILSLAPLKTDNAEKIVLRFYQDKLYEIAVQFRVNPDTLQRVFVQKYGLPQKIEGVDNYPSALIWQDAFTVLTLYVNARKQDGVIYHDKTVLGQQMIPRNLPRNY